MRLDAAVVVVKWLLPLLAACGQPGVAPVHNSAPIVAGACVQPPADWRPADMASVALHRAVEKSDEVRVLSWQQTTDDRPLRIDSALLWIKTASSGYWLAHLYRHPNDGARTHWELAMIFDRPGFRSTEAFEVPPTHAQLDELATASDFHFGPEQDFTLVAWGQCDETWMKSFGEKPWHAYPQK